MTPAPSFGYLGHESRRLCAMAISPDNPLIKLFRALPWQGRVVVSLGASTACCIAIWWFATHGWPDWTPHYLVKLQIWLFMGAPMAVLLAIVSFFYRRPDDEDH